MLILSRRPNESWYEQHPNGEVVKCTILSVRGQQVRIGFEADRRVVIVREELLGGEDAEKGLTTMEPDV